MRCLVTGAGGHIGSYLTRLLADRGHEVTAMVRPGGDLRRLDGLTDRVAVLRGDLDDIDAAAGGVRAAAPEVVFHLAWAGVTGAARNVPSNAVASVSGSLRLFRIAQEAGCRCWVGLGSQAEFGRQTEALREGLVPAPDTLYGVAKLSLSRLTEALCTETGVRYVWLRLAAAYGPMDDPRHLIPTLIARLLDGERPALTSGSQEWDYLYIEDAVEAIYRAGMMDEVQGSFVLGYGKSYPVRSIAERVRDLIDPSLALGFGEVPSDPAGQMSLQVDSTALRSATGWEPCVDLDTGLRRTIDWHRNDRRGSRKTTL